MLPPGGASLAIASSASSECGHANPFALGSPLIGLGPAGLADGLALDSERYRWITIGFAPMTGVPRSPGRLSRGLGIRSNTNSVVELRAVEKIRPSEEDRAQAIRSSEEGRVRRASDRLWSERRGGAGPAKQMPRPNDERKCAVVERVLAANNARDLAGYIDLCHPSVLLLAQKSGRRRLAESAALNGKQQ
jgi:hypothetical protein